MPNLVELYNSLKRDYDRETYTKGNDRYVALYQLTNRLNIILQLLNKSSFTHDPRRTLEEELAARATYETERLEQIQKLLSEFKTLIEANQQHLKGAKGWLSVIDNLLESARKKTPSDIKWTFSINTNAYLAAQLFALEVIPLNQGLDPFIGKDFLGNCVGHTDDWARNLHQRGDSDTRMISSNTI